MRNIYLLDKKTIVGLVHQMEKTVDYHYLERICDENLQQTSHITIRHIMYIANCVLLDVLTSEDGLKRWYQQSRA